MPYEQIKIGGNVYTGAGYSSNEKVYKGDITAFNPAVITGKQDVVLKIRLNDGTIVEKTATIDFQKIIDPPFEDRDPAAVSVLLSSSTASRFRRRSS